MFHPPSSLKTAMTPFPYAIALDATLAEAGRLMAKHNVHHLPVTGDDHEIVGILSGQDLMALSKGKRQGCGSGMCASRMSMSSLSTSRSTTSS